MRYTKEYLNLTEQSGATASDPPIDPVWKQILDKLGILTPVAGAAAVGKLGDVVKIGLSPVAGQMKRMSPASHAGGSSTFHKAIQDLTGTVTSGTIGKVGDVWKGIKRSSGPFSEYPTDPRRDPKTKR